MFRKIRVAIVVDDLKSVDLFNPRGIKVYEIADIVTGKRGFMKGTGHPQS
jgi:pyridoxamine 5'-phosphate oxidase family protein